jgi:hypothetical protein
MSGLHLELNPVVKDLASLLALSEREFRSDSPERARASAQVAVFAALDRTIYLSNFSHAGHAAPVLFWISNFLHRM